tara:strand:+ start:3835 stop:4737 length:903 start_codon:yes stop_codon:yes gene_type:complete
VIDLPYGVNINILIDDLRILSWEAADVLLEYSSLIKDNNYKNKIIKSGGLEDPVTMADLKVNELIIKRLKEKYKYIDWEILSEENVKIESHHCNTDADWLWVLDPLDGTKDFIQSTGNYAMHLALNYKRRPCMGIILIPEKEELWISIGERLWGEKRNKTLINCEDFKIKDFQEMTIVTSKNHKNEQLNKLIDKVNFKEVIVMGSVGCKIASIIRGESDVYISLSLPNQTSPKDWDFAAPEAVLRAAGGSITNLENKDLIYNRKSFNQPGMIIASNNKQNHKEICRHLREIIRKYDIFEI